MELSDTSPIVVVQLAEIYEITLFVFALVPVKTTLPGPAACHRHPVHQAEQVACRLIRLGVVAAFNVATSRCR